MARDEANQNAEHKIAEALRTGATELDLNGLGKQDSEKLNELPESLGQLTQLQTLDLDSNDLEELPDPIGELPSLTILKFAGNRIRSLPDWLGNLRRLTGLSIGGPPGGNRISVLPASIASLSSLNPELAAAYEQGIDAVKAYLQAKAEDQIVLNEAKLVLIGEGEVGKSCLLDALRDLTWQTHVRTHGITIEPVVLDVPSEPLGVSEPTGLSGIGPSTRIGPATGPGSTRPGR